MSDLNGKTVLVTGANRGSGRALVDAALAHGARRVYAGIALYDDLSDRTVVERHSPSTSMGRTTSSRHPCSF